MLKTNVIVRKVTNLHEARYCAGMGVNHISMPITNVTTDVMTPEKMKEISDWLSGVEVFGDIGRELPENFADYQLNGVETENQGIVKNFSDLPTSAIFSISVSPSDIESDTFYGFLEQYTESVSFFVLIAEKALEAYDLDMIKKLNNTYSIYWEFNYSIENVNNFIENCHPRGIALRGSKEIKIGVNDFDYLADILEALDTDEFL